MILAVAGAVVERGDADATCAARGLLCFAVVFADEAFTGARRAGFAAFAGVRAREFFFAATFDLDVLRVRAPIFFCAARCTLPTALFFPTLPAITLLQPLPIGSIRLQVMRRNIDATSSIVQCT